MSNLLPFQNQVSSNASQTTWAILCSIASHLSGNNKCRGQIYRVAIGMYDTKQPICEEFNLHYGQAELQNSIFFSSPAMIRHRGDTISEYAIQHIIKRHFPDVWAGTGYKDEARIHAELLIPGIYEYNFSASGKKRQWSIIKLAK